MTNLASRPVWGLTYEPTRFAGMQVLLQACFGDGTLAVPDLGADIRTALSFFARHGCSHLSATPTLWRRFLMHPDVAGLALRQITLGGEIADQAVLDALARPAGLWVVRTSIPTPPTNGAQTHVDPAARSCDRRRRLAGDGS